VQVVRQLVSSPKPVKTMRSPMLTFLMVLLYLVQGSAFHGAVRRMRPYRMSLPVREVTVPFLPA
jgi:hypothetical protein